MNSYFDAHKECVKIIVKVSLTPFKISKSIFLLNPMLEYSLLALIIAIAWFWIDTISKRELAIQLGKNLSQQFDLQFLDETVACEKITLKRNEKGQVAILRCYEFMVSSSTNDRIKCNLFLLGKDLHNWHIPPYINTTS
jgi:hypothetical protein